MIKSTKIKEEMPDEIEKNWGTLIDFIGDKLVEIGIEGNELIINELVQKPEIVQMLFTDTELFAEFMESLQDVISVDNNFKNYIKRMKEKIPGLTKEEDLKKGASQMKEALLKIFLDEINQIDKDDEIKVSFDLAKEKCEKFISKYLNLNHNKENGIKIQKNKKFQKLEKNEKIIQEKIEKETKQEKEKIIKQSQKLSDVNFEKTKMIEAEILIGHEKIINNDCSLRVQLDFDENKNPLLEDLERNNQLEILGNNEELQEYYNEWDTKPLLRVLTNKTKQHIQNNLSRPDFQNTNVQTDVKNFIEYRTDDVEDTIDLFADKDYLNELYMSGSIDYRDVERRILFPYSDNLKRYHKSLMLTNTPIYINEMRKNIYLYEREITKNFKIPEFYRVSEDEDNASHKVVVLYIFKISELSQNEGFGMTATFFALNNKNYPIQGTVSLRKIKNFYVFEGQYVCVAGSFEKGILEAYSVLPFDSENVTNNEWNVKEVETLSGGLIEINKNLYKEVSGEKEGQECWTRSLKILKKSSESYGDKIIEEVRHFLYQD
jgi:hypothetical protein